jgi:virulence-associated protein VapD
LKNAPQLKRVTVKNKEEMVRWFNQFNGITNCYTTVYDFDDFVLNDYGKWHCVDSSVILDRMFLDFDAHDRPLGEAYDDFNRVYERLWYENIQFSPYFSGKGFHIVVYGEVVSDIRSIQAYYTELAKDYSTLDRTGIQPKRLRRLPLSLNLSTVTEDCKGYYCVPFAHHWVGKPLEDILEFASDIEVVKDSKAQIRGSKLVDWPKVKPIDMESEVMIELPEALGKIPIIPCLQNAITVENPSHMARVYLIQWYRDLLSLGIRDVTPEKRKEIVHLIMEELKVVASKPEMWLDWDESVTRKHVEWIVNKGYNAPGCNSVLIPSGYCVGKCWRYHE